MVGPIVHVNPTRPKCLDIVFENSNVFDVIFQIVDVCLLLKPLLNHIFNLNYQHARSTGWVISVVFRVNSYCSV